MTSDPGGETADRALVERYLGDADEEAFRALYRRHTPVLFRFALRRLRARDAAEAAVQETWIRAARGLEGFRWRSSLRSWLVGIALNCCRERRRARFREPRLEPPEQRRITTPGRSAAGLQIDLERAVAELPERAREVLLLHDVEGYTHAEVGAILGIATGTSKSQLSRARAALRELLGTEEREHG